MTYDQFNKYKYRLALMAAQNKTKSPPVTEIKVNADDLKIMMRTYRTYLSIDAQGNAVIDGSRLVAA